VVGVKALLDAPPEAERPVSFRFGDQTGTAAPATRSEPSATLCLPRDGHADVELTSGYAATIDGPPLGPTLGPARDVGVVLSGVEVAPTDKSC
jgi:hypothetical protein